MLGPFLAVAISEATISILFISLACYVHDMLDLRQQLKLTTQAITVEVPAVRVTQCNMRIPDYEHGSRVLSRSDFRSSCIRS